MTHEILMYRSHSVSFVVMSELYMHLFVKSKKRQCRSYQTGISVGSLVVGAEIRKKKKVPSPRFKDKINIDVQPHSGRP